MSMVLVDTPSRDTIPLIWFRNYRKLDYLRFKIAFFKYILDFFQADLREFFPLDYFSIKV
jgi:hypothetical protein